VSFLGILSHFGRFQVIFGHLTCFFGMFWSFMIFGFLATLLTPPDALSFSTYLMLPIVTKEMIYLGKTNDGFHYSLTHSRLTEKKTIKVN